MNHGIMTKLEKKSQREEEIKEFAFKNAIYKIKNATQKFSMNPQKKVVSIKLFLEALQKSNNYITFVDNLEKSKHINKNILKITLDFFNEEISKMEIEAMIKNKDIINKIFHQ